MGRVFEGIWSFGMSLCFFVSFHNLHAQDSSQTVTVTLEEVSIEASKLDTPRTVLPFSLSVWLLVGEGLQNWLKTNATLERAVYVTLGLSMVGSLLLA